MFLCAPQLTALLFEIDLIFLEYYESVKIYLFHCHLGHSKKWSLQSKMSFQVNESNPNSQPPGSYVISPISLAK